MFKVDVPREEKTITYYVFDEGELVQTKILVDVGAIFMNNQNVIISGWDVTERGLFVMFTNPSPVMVLESDIKNKNINYDREIIPLGNNDFIDTISITIDDYQLLQELSKEQYKDCKKEDAEKDIETVKQLVKSKNPNYNKANPCGFA